jgi:ferritin
MPNGSEFANTFLQVLIEEVSNMLSEKMLKELNRQINAELYAAYLYLSMSADFQSKNLAGFANWMRVQATEEMTHAMKIYDFVHERGSRVTLKQVEEPPSEWSSPLAAFEDAYKHEQKVTGMINDLTNLAKSEKDHATEIFLQWFVTEQVEEEASADEIVQKLKLVGEAGGGMFMIDREMAGRKFTPETTA